MGRHTALDPGGRPLLAQLRTAPHALPRHSPEGRSLRASGEVGWPTEPHPGTGLGWPARAVAVPEVPAPAPFAPNTVAVADTAALPRPRGLWRRLTERRPPSTGQLLSR